MGMAKDTAAFSFNRCQLCIGDIDAWPLHGALNAWQVSIIMWMFALPEADGGVTASFQKFWENAGGLEHNAILAASIIGVTVTGPGAPAVVAVLTLIAASLKPVHAVGDLVLNAATDGQPLASQVSEMTLSERMKAAEKKMSAELKLAFAAVHSKEQMEKLLATHAAELERLKQEPWRTFATSNYKREYDEAVPISKAAQIVGEISRFIHVYCRVHGRTSESDAALAEAFADRLQQEAGAHADGGGGDLMAPVRATAELLWTSTSKFRGMGEHEKEFCSLLNKAIRDDDEKLAAPTASLSRGINAMLVEGRGGEALPFPPGEDGDEPGTIYRGGGFDDSLRDFFTVGKAYRQPAFLATSFLKSKAEFFRGMAQAAGYPSVLWTIHVDQSGKGDVTKRCKHVNFVSHSLVPGEAEYLFSAYSIFTVRSVEWGVGGAPHRIELDAATDNNAKAEGGTGRFATPVGSEELPLAPWS
jgi:hypothetical protein